MLGPGQFRLLRQVLKLRRREAMVVRALVGVVLILCTLGVGGYALAGVTPGWWGRAHAPPDAGRVATALENGVVTEFSRVRPARSVESGSSQAWAVRIKVEEINAWLATKLPRWVEGQPLGKGKAWPRLVHEVRLTIEGGAITIAARVGEGVEGADGRIVWVSCRPEVRAGELWLAAGSAGIGAIQIPLSVLLPTKGGHALVDAGEGLRTGWAGFPESPTLRAALRGEAPAVHDPTIRLADGRHVRLLDLKLEAEAIVLTCETGK